MKLSEFINLPKEEKLERIYQNGTPLQGLDNSMDLFSLYDFWVVVNENYGGSVIDIKAYQYEPHNQ